LALEDDNVSFLPNPIYAKGFLKKYAEFLGIDQKELIQQFEGAGLGSAKQVIMLEGEQLPAVDPERYFKKAFIWVAVFLLCVSFIVFLFSTHKGTAVVKKPPRQHRTRPVFARRPLVKKIDNNRKEAIKKDEVKPPVTQAPTKVSAVALNLLISAKKPCRFSLKADNKLIFEGFLPAGKAENWQAKDKFELSVSDHSAIELTLNNKRLGLAGRGALRGVLITRDGISHT